MTQGHWCRKKLRKCVRMFVLKTRTGREKKREGAKGVTRQLGLGCPRRYPVSC